MRRDELPVSLRKHVSMCTCEGLAHPARGRQGGWRAPGKREVHLCLCDPAFEDAAVADKLGRAEGVEGADVASPRHTKGAVLEEHLPQAAF